MQLEKSTPNLFLSFLSSCWYSGKRRFCSSKSKMYLYKVEMADRDIHLLQAMHNEEVANMLIEKNPYHDWGITVAFYALIHYFEYWLFNQPEKHTETSIPVDKNYGTPYAWREKLIEKRLSKHVTSSDKNNKSLY